MKKCITLLFLYSFLVSCKTLKHIPNPNLDFEVYDYGKKTPKDWTVFGNYNVYKDSLNFKSGRYSLAIHASNKSKYYSGFLYNIPNNIEGKTLTLKGYMKTKNVEGYCGLVLRIDKDQETKESNSMKNQNIKGTNTWKQYEITVPLHKEPTAIFIGGILSGKGTVWFDQFSVHVDGVDYSNKIEKPIINKAIFKKLKSEKYQKSNFEVDSTLTEYQINNLHTLAKKWGYLKYHHPKISAGTYHWDKELFKILPIIKTLNFKEKLVNWENSFGTNLPKNNSGYYIKMAPNVGNPIFQNEPHYPKIDWNDDGYKYLALFRLWSSIEYYHPSKHLINDWDGVLKQYIEKMAKTHDELSYKLILLELITEIKDTHSSILQMGEIIDLFFGKKIAAVEVKFIENNFLISKISDESVDVKLGDILISINGNEIENIHNTLKKYAIGSNKNTETREICRKILRTNRNSITLKLKRGSEIISTEISCVRYNKMGFFQRQIPPYKELANDIGYIYLGSLKKGEINNIMKQNLNKKGIIFDLRCYPSDFVVFNVSNFLLPQPTQFVKFTEGSIESPGEFSFRSGSKIGHDNPNHYTGKVAILVNELTQSNAEYTCMALQTAPKAKVIGSQTAGADGNVSKIYLPGNISFMISGIGVYYPDGRETQGIGIVPDIEVKPTIEGITKGEDEVLNAAIKYINESD